MIVAGYTKACPIVDWVEDEDIQSDLELNRKELILDSFLLPQDIRNTNKI